MANSECIACLVGSNLGRLSWAPQSDPPASIRIHTTTKEHSMNLQGLVTRLAFVLAFASSPAPAGEAIEASSTINPAPTEAFSAFDRFEIENVAMGSPYAGQPANDAALKDLQADLEKRVQPWLAQRNAAPAKADPPRVLVIAPRIDKVRFISTGARMWGGAFSGSSRVLVKVRITDKVSGTLIAEPEFYQHAAGMAGAWTFGAADKAMLERVSTLVANYLQSNYSQAAGGPTGKD
jgi:hypothetical protein